MAEAKVKKDVDVTKPFVATRNVETAVGSLTHGELVYLDPSNEHVKGLIQLEYVLPQEDYLAQTDEATLNQMERESGVSARESGSRPAQ